MGFEPGITVIKVPLKWPLYSPPPKHLLLKCLGQICHLYFKMISNIFAPKSNMLWAWKVERTLVAFQLAPLPSLPLKKLFDFDPENSSARLGVVQDKQTLWNGIANAIYLPTYLGIGRYVFIVSLPRSNHHTSKHFRLSLFFFLSFSLSHTHTHSHVGIGRYVYLVSLPRSYHYPSKHLHLSISISLIHTLTVT